MKKPFWKSPLMGRTHETGAYWAEVGLAQKALNEKGKLTTFSHGGSLKTDDDLEVSFFVNEICQSFDLRVATHKLPDTWSRDEDFLLISDDMAFNISYDKKNRATTINCYGLHEDNVRAAQALCRERISRKVTKGRVYVVAQGESGPYLHEIGTAGETSSPRTTAPRS
jgi:hypothetical protein